MLEDAIDFHEEETTRGRFVISTHHDGYDWEVIVEPDVAQLRLVVITAYEIEGPFDEA